MRSLKAVFLFTVIAALAHAQTNEGVDLDEYYRYPLSIGAEYRSLQAFSGFPSGFVVREFGSELRAPLPFFPLLQPFVRAANVSRTRSGSSGSDTWDHTQWIGSAGLGYSARLSRTFEWGAEAAYGYSQSYFANLDEEATVGSQGWLVDAGIRIGLIPSYNFAVDVRPTARYEKTLGPLTEFDGFSFGFGLSVSYRFGDDPDAPAAVIRALRLASGKLPPAFAAMQSYYAANPIGKLELRNEERNELRDVEVSFFQSGYMDAPTPVASIPSIAARGSAEVGVSAAFNQEVFKTEGITPLAGELIVRYRSRGRSAEQRFPVSYDLMDRTSIVWDDDRKVGAFITQSDSALRNFASYVRQSLKDESLFQLNAPLQNAAQLYAALASFGLVYQADPTSPFVKAQAGQIAVDSVNIGRSTLVRGTGDCDDLTVLFASLLETLGTETGFITVPGHIYAAFNTKLSPRDFKEIHPDRSMTIVVDDTIWVPVEITLIGRQGFLDAWRKGAELWKLYENDASKRSFHKTAAAQALYRPVSLRESDLGLQYGSKDRLIADYGSELGRLADASISELAEAARKAGDARSFNALGIANAKFGRVKDADAAFQRALRIEPGYAPAQVNLGNLAFIQRDFRRAASVFQAAASSMISQGKGNTIAAQKVLINLSKAHNALANFPDAKNAFEKAAAINPESVREFAYLAQAGASGVGRGSEQTDSPLFLQEE